MFISVSWAVSSKRTVGPQLIKKGWLEKVRVDFFVRSESDPILTSVQQINSLKIGWFLFQSSPLTVSIKY